MGGPRDRTRGMLAAAAAVLVLAPACLLEAPDAATPSPPPPPTPVAQRQLSSGELGERFGDAVYRVEVDGCGFLPGWGTAFAVHRRFLVTNWHVVAIDPRVTVTSRTGERLRAEVVSANRDEDIAVLRTDRPMTGVLELADPREVVEGDPLTVIGYPAPDGDFSVTSGIVRSIDGDGRLSTDATIDQGNSGGPGLSAEGKVAGVVFAVQPTRLRLVGLLLPVDLAATELEAAVQGAGTSDVLSCGELERHLLDLTDELERYFGPPPTPPPL